MLGGEYEAFRAEYEKPHRRGVRLNTLKCDAETLARTLPFPACADPVFRRCRITRRRPCAWRRCRCTMPARFTRRSPRASSAVTLLDPQPGEKVLDLCAAPGGKSTQIAALTGDRGLLWSNEVVRSRASGAGLEPRAHGREKRRGFLGLPEVLAEKLEGILTACSSMRRAPARACSGATRRRLPSGARRMSKPARPGSSRSSAAPRAACARAACLCIRPARFPRRRTKVWCARFCGRIPGSCSKSRTSRSAARPMASTPVRIFPMDGGEGHFAARFRRTAPNGYAGPAVRRKAGPADGSGGANVLRVGFHGLEGGALCARCATASCCCRGAAGAFGPRRPARRRGARRNEEKPHRACARHFHGGKAAQCRSVLHLRHDDPRLTAFLRGEEIPAEGLAGYTAVAVEGVVTGFGKASGGVLKNKYPKGLRIHG